jgi:hypothetical protein
VESVAKEETSRKQWEQTYGWMAEYDAKVHFSFHLFNKVSQLFREI